MLSLEVNDDELIKRLLESGKTSGRPDDADEALFEIELKYTIRIPHHLKNSI